MATSPPQHPRSAPHKSSVAPVPPYRVPRLDSAPISPGQLRPPSFSVLRRSWCGCPLGSCYCTGRSVADRKLPLHVTMAVALLCLIAGSIVTAITLRHEAIAVVTRPTLATRHFSHDKAAPRNWAAPSRFGTPAPTGSTRILWSFEDQKLSEDEQQFLFFDAASSRKTPKYRVARDGLEGALSSHNNNSATNETAATRPAEKIQNRASSARCEAVRAHIPRKLIDSVVAVAFDVFLSDLQYDESHHKQKRKDGIQSNASTTAPPPPDQDEEHDAMKLFQTDDSIAYRVLRNAMSDKIFSPSSDTHSRPNSSYFTFPATRNAKVYSLRQSSTWGASEESAQDSDNETCGHRVVPLQLDVLYTYVNPNADSHRGNLAQHCDKRRTAECLESRFRDWDELRYSMRTVFERGGMGGDGSGLVRNIHIVVAHEDQVPPWLNRSHPAIRVHTHRDIFPPSEHADALPTFNSNAIEAALHRTPGLSRFFVYFNNDMFWGRPLSLFDYFRPLSRARQEHRRRTSKDARCLLDFAEQQHQQERSHDDAGDDGGSAGRRRVVVLLEPIQYFEHLDEVDDRLLVAKPLEKRPKSQHSNRSDTCRLPFGYRIAEFFDLRMKIPRLHDQFHKFVNHNREVLFAHYDMPPSHSFAHYPRLIDLDVLHGMLENELRQEAQAVRKRRLRSPEDLWTPFTLQHASLAHRRFVDGRLACALGRWKPPAESTLLRTRLDPAILSPFYDTNSGEFPLWMGEPLWQKRTPTKPSPRRAVPRGTIAHEKLNHPLVSLNEKPDNAYQFCMLRSALNMVACQREVKHSKPTKLFVTLNDDVQTAPMVAQVRASMASLLSHLGGETAAPWEQVSSSMVGPKGGQNRETNTQGG